MPDFCKQFSTDVQFEAELVYIAFRTSTSTEATEAEEAASETQ
jgi:hypothetical protein